MINTLISSLFVVSIGINMNFLQLDSIIQYFNICDNICIFYDNTICNINNIDTIKIKTTLNKICINSHEMPALGVSIHEDTINALHEGMWLIFKYHTRQYHQDMPFDELLIKINNDSCGFNIIRGNNGIYDGRCYYLNLDNNMSSLYNTLLELIKNTTSQY